jgi:NAD/NADP transhydrogenase beta subunit
MSMNLVTTLYLIASICFIQALKGLSHPTTSRRGNLFGMLGMALAVSPPLDSSISSVQNLLLPASAT